ncbi:MAG TPA: SCO family protein [Thermoanaerobaculia bacterium]|nr:SCO family protein [Thermoanaerobaculia bacterium]
MPPQIVPTPRVLPAVMTALAILWLFSGPSLRAQMEHHHHDMPMPANAAVPQPEGRIAIPDVSVLDQDGRPVRFYSDLVRGQVVAVNFIFTTCTTVCPPMGVNFARLQKLLTARAAAGGGAAPARLISVSVDPTTDTPERLKAWAEKFGRGPGWTLVTGPKADVDRLLRTLQAYTPSYNDHSPLILVGNDATGVWQRMNGLAPPAEIARLIDRVAGPATVKK